MGRTQISMPWTSQSPAATSVNGTLQDKNSRSETLRPSLRWQMLSAACSAGAQAVVLGVDRPQRIGQLFQHLNILQPADQREQGNVEKDGAPVEVPQNFLEVLRIDAPAQQIEHHHRRHRPGSSR